MEANQREEELIECGCGCGQTRKKYGAGGRLCKFINGHNFGTKKKGRKLWRGNDWKYRRWQKEVLAAYQRTCQMCGTTTGTMTAHHVKPWKDYPDLRYSVENGVALCFKCHMHLHGIEVE